MAPCSAATFGLIPRQDPPYRAMTIAQSGATGISPLAISLISADIGLVRQRRGEYDLAIEVYAKPSGCLIDPLARKVAPVTVTAADVGASLRVVVTAKNDLGTGQATSNPTGVVGSTGPLPANTTPPVISGAPRWTLTNAQGNWIDPSGRMFTRCEADRQGNFLVNPSLR